MRLYAAALAMGAMILAACGGADAEPEVMETPVAAEAPVAPAAGAAVAAPVTGTVHEVRMIGDDQGYRFEPANLTIAQGDGVKFIMVSGGPHNVAFEEASLPAGAAAQLAANLPETKMSPLATNMYMNPNEEFTISFAGVPAGTYAYNCTPHLAMGMKGNITVQ